MARGLSCSKTCGIVPDRGSNLRLLLWQVGFLPLTYQGGSTSTILWRRSGSLLVGRLNIHFSLKFKSLLDTGQHGLDTGQSAECPGFRGGFLSGLVQANKSQQNTADLPADLGWWSADSNGCGGWQVRRPVRHLGAPGQLESTSPASRRQECGPGWPNLLIQKK